MGEIETRGPRAAEFLRHLLTNDIAKVAPGGAQYSLLCREDGGVLDDLFTYRFAPDGEEERFLTVVNASNADSDFDWFRRQAEGWDGVEVADRSADYAMLALQGPRALEVLSAVLDAGRRPGSLPSRRGGGRGRARPRVPHRLHRRGRGRAAARAGAAPAVWDALLERGRTTGRAGRARHPAPRGLLPAVRERPRRPTARRSRRGLKWACALDKDFVGAERLREQAEQGTAEKLVPFVFTGPGIPRQGLDVLSDGERVGSVTSGTLSPCMEVGIGMAYVSAALAEPGTDLTVDVRGKERPARVSSKPLYKKEH